MSEPFIGEIRMFAGPYAPQGFANCDGQILSIAQNAALFSILGTTYGGNGSSNFALPDLRGRHAMHAGEGPGLSNRSMGSKGGVELVSLSSNQIPSHTHALRASDQAASSLEPAGTALSHARTEIYGADSATATMVAGTVASTGFGAAHENRQPYATIRYIIALVGIFPSPS